MSKKLTAKEAYKYLAENIGVNKVASYGHHAGYQIEWRIAFNNNHSYALFFRRTNEANWQAQTFLPDQYYFIVEKVTPPVTKDNIDLFKTIKMYIPNGITGVPGDDPMAYIYNSATFHLDHYMQLLFALDQGWKVEGILKDD